MGKKHTDALKAKIQEVSVLAGDKTAVTMVEHGTVPPYCVIHPAQGTNTQERVTGPRSTKHPRFTLHVVGETAEQVLVVMDLIEQKLFPGGSGITLTVTGERSRPVWFESPLPVQVQTDPQPPVVYGVIETGWASDPTT